MAYRNLRKIGNLLGSIGLGTDPNQASVPYDVNLTA